MRTAQTRSRFSLRKSRRCFLFAFASIICWVLLISNASVSGAAVAPRTPTNSGEASDSSGLGVIDLTSKSFGSTVGFVDGELWLIEFYTPTCSHCVHFAPTYENIAKTLHSSTSNKKIRVARVNCIEEKALMTRFGIQAFPSFFVVAGWEVYEFHGKRSETTLTNFATGGYKKQNVSINNIS